MLEGVFPARLSAHHGGQDRMMDPLKLELQSFVSLQEDSGKQTRVHSSPRGRTLECTEAESCPADYLQEAENFSTGMVSIKE